ncbi:hypothetical protein HU200_019066 [Digitaria exilis]|uniref:Uncharacterized protein n=1 Tax=Digitaria exilis TaxID=1010633 RepID=A0A835F427_9POAL|nr:hypothetical protein HU200_019066 [Digitaria exilis]
MASDVKSSSQGRGRGQATAAARASHPQLPAAVATPAERNEAAAECTAACCVLCACLPVAALCCAARAWLELARGCGHRRRPRRALAPSASSSSFSDE